MFTGNRNSKAVKRCPLTPELVETNQGQIADADPAALQVPQSSINVDSTTAQPERKATRKRMSARSQDGTLVEHGKWWRVRVRIDVPGVEARSHKSLKVALISDRLTQAQLENKAREIIAAAGVNSEERFNQVVIGGEVTFREQAKEYLRDAVSRNREPIRDTTSIEGALRKWILPEIGDKPLSAVDSLTLKPLVRKMVKGGLSPRTCEKYVLYCKQIVASLQKPDGEPIYPRVWNPEVMDLPVVVYRQQKRPAQKLDGINLLIVNAKSDEQRYLFVLLASSGLRISEALALEAKHFINDGRTIVVKQQVMKDCPKITDILKTDASYRQVDLHPDVAKWLGKFIEGKSGLVLKTENNTPYLYGNIAEDWLDPLLSKLGLYESGMGWHSFRRYRNTHLRKQLVQEDHRMHWMGHQPKEMSEVYSMLKEDVPARLAEAERCGLGFTLPTPNPVVVPNVPKIRRKKSVARVIKFRRRTV